MPSPGAGQMVHAAILQERSLLPAGESDGDLPGPSMGTSLLVCSALKCNGKGKWECKRGGLKTGCHLDEMCPKCHACSLAREEQLKLVHPSLHPSFHPFIHYV